MKPEQPGLMRQSHLSIMKKYINPRNGKGKGGPTQPPRNNLRRHSESFWKLGVGIPAAGSASDEEKRLAWVRSQNVCGDAEFDSSFGRRRLTYADSTASGRCVRYIEDFIVDSILRFYDMRVKCL